MTSVELESVTKVFRDGTVAVDDLSLRVASGELLVLLGPSGCGKSTVLRIVAGLERPTAGMVYLDGAPANHLRPHERGAAMVFQNFALYPHLTVEQNLAFPLQLARRDPSEITGRVTDVAAALGIGDTLSRRPWEVSGGERQRVAIGRALVRDPRLWLFDEPLSNVDSVLRAELRAEIVELVRQSGATAIYVTHDQTEALTIADRIAILRGGVLLDVGTPAQVYQRPTSMYVASFFGSPRMNLVYAHVVVDIDSQVVLHIGQQRLAVPADDYRRHVLTHYHDESIVVGLRPEAVSPVAPTSATGTELRGRVRYFEHLGHESLAYLDVGAFAAVVDPLAEERHETRPDSGVTRFWRFRRRQGPARPMSPDTGRHHRRPAEVAVRLPPYPNVRIGSIMTVRVHVDQLHFFDSHGRRIDPSHR